MALVRKLLGWLFTYPPYRDISAAQSEALVALLALALHADGKPHPAEREELEREITGVPLYWADEAGLRQVIKTYVKRLRDESFAHLVTEVHAQLDGLSPEFLLTGAAFICHGDDDLTELERKNLTLMGQLLGLDDAVIASIVGDPTQASERMFAASLCDPAG